MANKKYKVGDWIFFECYDGSIGDAVVTKIEPRLYEDRREDGRSVSVSYDMLYLGKNTATEDYNCLDEDDPRVIEYKKTCADPRGFVGKFSQFLEENKFDVTQPSIQNYLYSILI